MLLGALTRDGSQGGETGDIGRIGGVWKDLLMTLEQNGWDHRASVTRVKSDNGQPDKRKESRGPKNGETSSRLEYGKGSMQPEVWLLKMGMGTQVD